MNISKKIIENTVYVWHFLIDFIFPPSEKELLLRSLSSENIYNNLPKALLPPYSFIDSLFAYKNSLVSELIWSIKYKKDEHAIKLGGYALYEELKDLHRESQKKFHNDSQKKIILIPIPISRKRHRERGFNQCELLIDEIIRLNEEGRVGEKDKPDRKLNTKNNLETDNINKFEKRYDILKRIKDIEKQTHKNRQERLVSSTNIFQAKKCEELLDKNIVIIDDVVTTGSTLKSARDTLMKSGYKNVRAITLAH